MQEIIGYERDGSLPRWAGGHAFRRGLETNLHANDVADKTIMTVLRHSNVRVTQDSYIKTIPETGTNAMEAIAKNGVGRASCIVLAPSGSKSRELSF